MNSNAITSTITTILPNKNVNLIREGQAKLINQSLGFAVNATANTTRIITNIPLSQEEYKIALHFKIGGLIKKCRKTRSFRCGI